ncbi:MAG: UDP-N-acetylglucosamine 1-carboxyvinyltransferase [Deltaproteobacteria bacterium]|nr:UDP-N-acetylglucosamine 1-carboxyvinyltransferase [Deltaproteobacteria bacterium]
MSFFRIEGGVPLNGSVQVSGNKNEALPVVAAALLTDEPVTLRNLPDILDVRVMLEVAQALGAEVTRLGPHDVRIHTPRLASTRVPDDLGRNVRASILFAGALLGRAREVQLPPPGGDVIGRRRLDTHFDGFTALGAAFQVNPDGYALHADRLAGADLLLDEASVTATENLLMAAAVADGTTVLGNCASEPHVQGLARMLVSMGADIEGIGSNRMVVHGVSRLGGCDYAIGPDYLEVGSFIGLAAVTGGQLRIERAAPEHLRMIRMVFRRLGVETLVDGEDVVVPGGQQLRIRQDLGGGIPKIDDAIWPQFPTDLMSIAITVATQSQGTVLFFEKMFEGRMFFVDHLIGMGAQIILCDPHRVVVVGPSRLVGQRVQSPDVRAGMAMLIAALCAQGVTTIHNIRNIDRGYERIDQKLRSLGARIERFSDAA